ncbi:TAXI family TRAP transporter solute-binding subunit [Shumkonia mesophila]|uniref:TAXI family TRAP transporter solute-binding subunit n=1 Tax=Shumkonia mesophila TaxID=2838854 RepID=UPI00293469E1|nr:TAXI family TRAP transporter solute-binding subunit [Shumkonia mesophila]
MVKSSIQRMMFVAALGAVGTMAAVSGAAAADDWKAVKGDVRWASASMGSTTQVLLSGVEAVLKGVLPNVRMSVLTTSGSVENPRLLEAGETELAGVNSDSAWQASTGMKPYGKPIEMQMVLTAYGNTVIFLTRPDSGIKKMEDLAGHPVSVGPSGSGGYKLAYSVLAHGYDLWGKIKPYYIAYNDQISALRDGTIDAMMAHLNDGMPTSYLAEADATGKVYVLGQDQAAIERIQKVEGFQTAYKLTPKNLKNLDREILAMTNHHVEYARADIPEDLVYALVRAFYENSKELGNYHPLAKNIDVKHALDGAFKGIAVHPGAARYYKEAGVWRDDLTVGQAKKK